MCECVEEEESQQPYLFVEGLCVEDCLLVDFPLLPEVVFEVVVEDEEQHGD